MKPTLQRTPALLAMAASILAGCSPDDGGSDLNKGSYTIEDFDYDDPHAEEFHPLRGTTTAILGRAESAFLNPGGLGGRVLELEDGPPTWPDDFTWVPGGPRLDLTTCGQLDGDPEEEFAAGLYTPGQPGLLSLATLEPDTSWLVRFTLDVGDTAPAALATGDIDADGRDEVAVLWSGAGGPRLSVFDDDLMVFESAVLTGYGDLDLGRLRLGLADLDADRRDEIVLLGNRGPYWDAHWTLRRPPVLEVLDDAEASFGLLVKRELLELDDDEVHEGGPAQLVTGDFDRFHEGQELCVTRLAYPAVMLANTLHLQYESFALFADPTELRRWLRGAPDQGGPHMVMMTPGNFAQPGVAPPAEALVGFPVRAADLDGDGSDELVSTWFTVGGGSSPECPSSEGTFLAFNIPLDLTSDEVAQRWGVPDAPPPNLPIEFPSVWDYSANFTRVGSYAVLDPEHAPVARADSSCSGWPDFKATCWDLAAADQDADAREELSLSGWDGGFFTMPAFIACVEAVPQAEGQLRLEQMFYAFEGMMDSPFRVLTCDWDGDDVRVRYTGHKELALGSPIPLVLMAAPPTKSGITQNYSRSETVYETSTSTENAYSVRTGASAGVWLGYEVSDPFGIFSASARAKFESELAHTEKQLSQVTFSKSHTTSHDQDVILFQGTLYESFAYEIVAAPDPTAIGRILTLDIPRGAKVYKWTVDFYNQVVAPQFAITSDLLHHDIGDPASYLSEGQGLALLTPGGGAGTGYVGWMSAPMPVGQGSGSEGVTIELETAASSATAIGWSVTAEAEFKAGSFVAGYSVGISQDYVYEVTTSKKTCFHGEVGDIKNPADYQDWTYDFGLLAYTHGLLCDGDNQPVGIEQGVVPFQIETYFTHPAGAGYP